MISRKTLALGLAVAFTGALVAGEAYWRMQHFPVNGPVVGRWHVAQVRALTESSQLPYGQGVFVRHRFVPLWLNASLVFAGYCETRPSVEWKEAGQLIVNCKVREGQPARMFQTGGVAVTHHNAASQERH
ncbi:hypothetical protein [Roseateles amylovorans]|uniref:DUF2850 domain-containing protein n=1 Tax=Roseateles amylovorans TaxID=2978473 RepID=A0ABY6AV04_9BURK|nr:hypothetical protein [Roseateles amylovorans]UXH76138.1 hypothetical protein N4261_13755 [Roseateles amylovorans]